MKNRAKSYHCFCMWHQSVRFCCYILPLASVAIPPGVHTTMFMNTFHLIPPTVVHHRYGYNGSVLVEWVGSKGCGRKGDGKHNHQTGSEVEYGLRIGYLPFLNLFLLDFLVKFGEFKSFLCQVDMHYWCCCWLESSFCHFVMVKHLYSVCAQHSFSEFAWFLELLWCLPTQDLICEPVTQAHKFCLQFLVHFLSKSSNSRSNWMRLVCLLNT